MYTKTKRMFAFLLAMSMTTLGVFANEWNFAVTDVKVVDQNTFHVTFNKDVLEDVSFFEFLLTPKSDDTREIVLSNLRLANSNVVEASIAENFNPMEEYNFIVVFASDKDGNVIETGIDGMVTFTAPESFGVSLESGEFNAAPTEEMSVEVPEYSMDEVSTDTNWGNDVPVVATETVAATVNELPQTGPKEMMFILLAMLLGFGFMYARRKA